MTSAEAAGATERALSEIAEAALGATCGHCWSGPGDPCVTLYPGGTHAARLARAARRGLITAADLMVALDALGVFTEASVLYETAVAA